MPRKSSIAIFIAATSALAISSPVNAGEQDIGGLKEWNCLLYTSDAADE